MNKKDLLQREEQFASWRLATLLAFNGLLLASVTGEKIDPSFKSYLLHAAPALGFLISVSVFGVALISARKKFQIHIGWPEKIHSPIHSSNTAWSYYLMQFFGPYLLSPILCALFWIGFAFHVGQ